MRNAKRSFDNLSPFTLNCDTPWMNSLKSTSPLPSASNISITRCTRGFCCSSGSDINSSTLSAPELSKSSLRKRLPNRRISSASTAGGREREQKKYIFSFGALHFNQMILFSRESVFPPPQLHPHATVLFLDGTRWQRDDIDIHTVHK